MALDFFSNHMRVFSRSYVLLKAPFRDHSIELMTPSPRSVISLSSRSTKIDNKRLRDSWSYVPCEVSKRNNKVLRFSITIASHFKYHYKDAKG